MANQYLALSLFIMLLSFFIILVALSNFEDAKSRPVLNSLTIAFSSKDNVEEMSPNVENDPMQSFRSGDALDKIQAFFTAQIPGVDVQKNRLGTMMHLRMKLDDFEKNMMAPVRESENVSNFEGPFLQTIVALLNAEDTIPYRMDILLHTQEEPAVLYATDPENLQARMRQVARFTENLENAGMPTQLVTSALSQGDPEYIDLYFRRYVPFNPMGEQ